MTMAAAETRRQEREIPSRSREKFESSLGRRDGVAEVTETTNLALYTPPGRRHTGQHDQKGGSGHQLPEHSSGKP
jgi:hypothetical protein